MTDTVRHVIALHRRRYVFPVMLAVTKLSGSGADSVFMGVLKVGPAPLNPSCSPEP